MKKKIEKKKKIIKKQLHYINGILLARSQEYEYEYRLHHCKAPLRIRTQSHHETLRKRNKAKNGYCISCFLNFTIYAQTKHPLQIERERKEAGRGDRSNAFHIVKSIGKTSTRHNTTQFLQFL